jgi:cytochrome c biogenesis protein
MWRWLTSMRTALLLLLLLAIAAIPGSVLPQKSINIELVRQYVATHPTTGPWLDRLGFFQVYASPWFSAVYLLLFLSLVGCLVPRLRTHLVGLVARPPEAPAHLSRLPRNASGIATALAPTDAAAELATALRRRRWRVQTRSQPDGSVTVAAEKGYLKETGNLVFHFALLALLIGVASGSWYGWNGNRLLVAGDGFCDSLQQYDESSLGARTTAADLPPFCLSLINFQAAYLDDGQPIQYTAQVSYTDGIDGPSHPWRLEVNSPLRLPGANIYLLGHGYAPILRYTDVYGHSQTQVVPFLPEDEALTSTGAAKFTDVNIGPGGSTPQDETSQIGFVGVYLPTMPTTANGTLSVYPGERNPGLVLTAYKGNLGLGSGATQSVYELDQGQIASHQLVEVGTSKALAPGQSFTLPDGSRVDFLGTQPWITVSVRYDPGEPIVLGGAVALLAGLTVSLGGKRRRVWARVVAPTSSAASASADAPASADQRGRSLITLGGLARTETPGFADEFDRIVALARGLHHDEPGRDHHPAADRPDDQHRDDQRPDDQRTPVSAGGNG